LTIRAALILALYALLPMTCVSAQEVVVLGGIEDAKLA